MDRKADPVKIADKAEIAQLRRENARLAARVEELEAIVSTDTLTPLFNRRHFTETLERWCQRAARYGGQFGLLYLDVDLLKSTNDIQGHAVGDDILRGIALALLGATRKSDVVARIGGDEFAILLDTISSEKLNEKTAAMRALLADLPIVSSASVIKVNVSVGMSAITRGMTPAQILHAADQDMYAHKREKRLHGHTPAPN